MTSNDGTQEALAQLARAAVLIEGATQALAAAEPAPGHAAYFAWLVEQAERRLTRAQVHAADALRRSGAHQLDEDSYQAILEAGLHPTDADLEATAGQLTSGRGYYKDAAGLMKERLNVSIHVAKARLTHAESLIAEVAEDGERLAPRYPQLAEEFQKPDTEPALVLGAAHQLRKAEPDLAQAPDPEAARTQLETDAIDLIRHEPATARRHLVRMIEQEAGENRPLEALLSEVGLYRSGMRRGLVHYRLSMLPQDAELIESMCAQIDNPQGIAGNREELQRLVYAQYLAGARDVPTASSPATQPRPEWGDPADMPDWGAPQAPDDAPAGAPPPMVAKSADDGDEHDAADADVADGDQNGISNAPQPAEHDVAEHDVAGENQRPATSGQSTGPGAPQDTPCPAAINEPAGDLDAAVPTDCRSGQTPDPAPDRLSPGATEAAVGVNGVQSGGAVPRPTTGVPVAGSIPPELRLPFEELRPEFRHLTALVGLLRSGGAVEGKQPGIVQPQVTVIIDYFKMMEAGRNFAVTEGGLPLAAGAARTMLCNGRILPVVLGARSQVLDIGRQSRFFRPHQRKALQATYRGCAYPGCTMPASRCEADHIQAWEDGGVTSVENGMLLCPMHHHARHCGVFRVIANEDGPPMILLPKNLDPHQRPRLNTYWHSPSEAIARARSAREITGAA